MRDYEIVKDKLALKFKNKIIEFLGDDSEREVRGEVKITAYERGKKKIIVHDHNIWTLEGRAYSCMVKTYQSYTPLTPTRRDRIRYIGFGTGNQPEVSTVSRLVTPIAFDALGNFLASLDVPTFSTDNTIATFSRTFATNEISVAGTQTISEIGIFTDGISPTYAPGTRDITLAAALSQIPMGYKSFEPFPKTMDITLTVEYSLFHN